MPAIRIGLAEMTYTAMPNEDPARHAWAAVEVLLGEPLELTFVDDGDGDRLGFWRCRFYSDRLNRPVTIVLRADSVKSVKPAELRYLQAKRDQIQRLVRIVQERRLHELGKSHHSYD